jgi:hypothetical protein
MVIILDFQKEKSKTPFKEALTFLQGLYSEFSVAVGIIFSAPMLITKTIAIPVALLMRDYFRRVAHLFAWAQEKHDDIATIESDMEALVQCETLFRSVVPKKQREGLTTPIGTSTDCLITLKDFKFNPHRRRARFLYKGAPDGKIL